MGADLSLLNRYQSTPDALPADQFEAAATTIEELEKSDPTQAQAYLDALRANSAFSNYLHSRDMRQTTQPLSRSGLFVENPGAGGIGSRESIQLGGVSGARSQEVGSGDHRGAPLAATAAQTSTPPSYSVHLSSSHTDTIVLFKDDPTRERRIVFSAKALSPAKVADLYRALLLLQVARRQDATYKLPLNQVEVVLEFIADLEHLYTTEQNVEKQHDLQTALAWALHVVDEQVLKLTPPERFSTRADLLQAYYRVRDIVTGLPKNGHPQPLPFLKPILLREADQVGNKISLEFAGQSSDYLSDLAYLYAMPDVRPFIDQMIARVQALAENNSVARASGFYSEGFGVKAWLSGKRPSADYLMSSPVSQSLIFITQSARYLYLKHRGFDPKQNEVQAAAGHSQGVMAAVLAAQFLDDAAYAKEAEKMAVYLFFQGLRMQEVMNGFAEPTRAEIQAAGLNPDSDAVSPMAFVMGLTAESLQSYINQVNAKLPKDEQIYLSITNTRLRQIVSGPAKSLLVLYKLLNETMQREQAASKAKRLEKAPLEMSFSFLKTTAPFHSPYMQAMKEKLAADLKREAISFNEAKLLIPVLHTHDGRDLRHEKDLTQALIEMQSTDTVGYPAVSAALRKSVVVDVGPGEDILGATRSNEVGSNTGFVAAGVMGGLKELFAADKRELSPRVDYSKYKPEVVRLPDGRLVFNTRYTRFVHKEPVVIGGMTPTTGNVDIVVKTIDTGYQIELAGGAQGTASILREKVEEISRKIKPGETIAINLIYLSAPVWGLLPTVEALAKEGYPIGGITVAAGVPGADEAKAYLDRWNELQIWNNAFKPGNQSGIDAVIKIAKENPTRPIVAHFELGVAGGHHSWETDQLLRANYRRLRDHDNIILLVGGGVRNQEDAARYLDGSWNDDGVAMPVDGVFIGTRVMATEEAKTAMPVKERLASSPGAEADRFPKNAYGKSSDVMHATAGDGEPIHYTNTTAAGVSRWLEKNAVPANEGDKPRVKAWIEANKADIIAALNMTQKPYFAPVDAEHPVRTVTDMSHDEVLRRMVELMHVPSEGGWIDFSMRDYVGRYMRYLEDKVRRPDARGAVPPSFFTNAPVWNSANNPPLQHYLELEENPTAAIARFFEKYPELKEVKSDAIDLDQLLVLSSPGKYLMKPINFIVKIDERIWNNFASDSLWQSESEYASRPRREGARPGDAVLPEPGPTAVAGIPSVNESIGEVLDTFNQGMINRLLVEQLNLKPSSVEIRDVETQKPAATAFELFQAESHRHADQLIDLVTLEANPEGTSRYEIRRYDFSDADRARLNKVTYLGGPVLGSVNPIKLKSIERESSKDGVETWVVIDPDLAMRPKDKGVDKGQTEFAQFLYGLAANDTGLLTTLLTSNRIVRDQSSVSNYLRDVLMPRKDQILQVTRDEVGRVVRIVVIDPSISTETPVVELAQNDNASVKADFKATLRFPDPRLETRDESGKPTFHPLTLYYRSNPTQGYALIHEEAGVQNEEIRRFYESLMFAGERGDFSMDETLSYTAPLLASDLRQLNGSLGDRGRIANQTAFTFADQHYEATLRIVEVENAVNGKRVRITGEVKNVGGRDANRPPLNAWMRVITEPFFKTFFAKEVQANIFNLVHLNADFTLDLDGTDGRAIVNQEVFIRGNFSKEPLKVSRNETVSEEMLVKTAADVAVLRARPWFKSEDGIEIQKGDRLRFDLHVVNVFHQDGTKSFQTTGAVYRGDEKVGTVSSRFEPDTAEKKARSKRFKSEDLVLAFLNDHKLSKDPILLVGTGEKIERETRAPTDMTAYALASSDLNPIHTNYYFAAIAGLQAPIVHGMWTFGKAIHLLTQNVADGDPNRVLSLKPMRDKNGTVRPMFSGMVNLGEELVYTLEHVANKDGNLYYTVTAFRKNDRETPLFSAEAVIAPPETMDIFTGQGSARLKSFDDFKDSPAAQAVIEKAEAYFNNRHGFSIRQIDREGGFTDKTKGVSYIYADGKRVDAPKGKKVLDLTQFQQVMLGIYADAALAAMQERGVRTGREMISGHSLGEYNALGSLGIFPDDVKWELVYQRGLTMQNILSTPEFAGQSYRMISVKPHYYQETIGSGITSSAKPVNYKRLTEIVDQVMKASGEFIQVVNLNTQDQAYSVVGTLAGIEALKSFLDENLSRVSGKDGPGVIDIEGVLVPFHSVKLLPGVAKFRETLDAKFPQEIPWQRLDHRYIPNFTATPFEVSKAYVKLVYDKTEEITKKYGQFLKGQTFESKRLKDIYDRYEVDGWEKRQNELARILIIELLAYQFASPVLWIDTQKIILQGTSEFPAVPRVREIGSTVLSGMLGAQATKTPPLLVAPEVASVGTPDGRALILNNAEFSRGRESGKAASPKSTAPVAPQPAPSPASQAPAPVVIQAAPAAAPVAMGNVPAIVANAKGAPADTPTLSVTDAVLAIVALKTKKAYPIDLNLSIDALSGGISTTGNQIASDIVDELGIAADEIANPKQIPLNDLIAAVKTPYKAPGSVLRVAFDEYVVKSLKRAGFDRKSIEGYLIGERLLPPNQMINVMNWMTVLGRENFFDGVSPETARAKLDEAVNQYAVTHTLAIPMKSLMGGSGASAGVASVSSEALNELEERYFGVKGVLSQTARDFLSRLGVPWQEWVLSADRERVRELEAELSTLDHNHIREYARLTRGIYDKQKIISLQWNWTDLLATKLYADLVKGNVTDERAIENAKRSILLKTEQKHLAIFERLKERATGDPSLKNRERVIGVFDDLIARGRAIVEQKNGRGLPPLEALTAPKTEITKDGVIRFSSQPRVLSDGTTVTTFLDFAKEMQASAAPDANAQTPKTPYVSMRTLPTDDNGKTVLSEPTQAFLDEMVKRGEQGFDFSGKVFWITGASEDSTAEAMTRLVLSGGGTVVLGHYGSGKRTPEDEVARYKTLYQNYASSGAKLHIVPMNQGNQKDIAAVETWMDERDLAPDVVVPFGAVSTRNTFANSMQGNEAGAEDIMLNSPTWMMAAAARLKQKRSPQSGDTDTAGNVTDLALKKRLAVAGIRIGWTNTSLMKEMGVLSEGIEKEGVRTYTPTEMGFILATLAQAQVGTAPVVTVMPLSPNHGSFGGDMPYGNMKRGVEAAYQYVAPGQNPSVFLDANGGFESVADISGKTEALRVELTQAAQKQAALYAQEEKDKTSRGDTTDADRKAHARAEHDAIQPNFRDYLVQVPDVPDEATLEALKVRYPQLQNLKRDLDKTYVVVGMDEFGPYFNARLRWQIESRGEFSLEGAIEMARRMGKVAYRETRGYTGWWDLKADKPIAPLAIKETYEKEMLENSGIRFVDPDLQNFDPLRVRTYMEGLVHQAEGVEWAATDEADARAIVDQHIRDGVKDGSKAPSQDSVYAYRDPRSKDWKVHLPAGAKLYTLKSLKMTRYVAGQIPKGWSAEDYGIPKELIDAIDNVTLFNLISQIGALYSAGMTNPVEAMAYLGIPLDKVADTAGGGLGGMNADKELQVKHKGLSEKGEKKRGDALQELLINVIKAYAIMNLSMGYGPNNTPVTACATAASSVEMAIAMLEAGEADIVYVGGFDDYSEVGGVGFQEMNATASTPEMLAKGIQAFRMSRANDARRGGFVEAQGAGTLILTRASLALKPRGPEGKTLPIYAVVDMVKSAADGAGKSVPAPGGGLLKVAQGRKSEDLILDSNIRARFGALRDQVYEDLRPMLREEIHAEKPELDEAALDREADRLAAVAADQFEVIWTADYHKLKAFADSTPTLQLALSKSGLTIDDIALIYQHGTSTGQNDPNEAKLFDTIFKLLGRKAGSQAIMVSQKTVTGHPKGAAAAWQMDGLIQAMNSGTVPGNRNLDDPDSAYVSDTVDYSAHLLYSDQPIAVGKHQLMAGLFTSLGFGHVGVMGLVTHSDLLFAGLPKETLDTYRAGLEATKEEIYRSELAFLTGKTPYFVFDPKKPFEGKTEDDQKKNEALYLTQPKDFVFDTQQQVHVLKKRVKNINEPNPDGGPRYLPSEGYSGVSTPASTAKPVTPIKPKPAASHASSPVKQSAPHGTTQPVERGLRLIADLDVPASPSTQALEQGAAVFLDGQAVINPSIDMTIIRRALPQGVEWQEVRERLQSETDETRARFRALVAKNDEEGLRTFFAELFKETPAVSAPSMPAFKPTGTGTPVRGR